MSWPRKNGDTVPRHPEAGFSLVEVMAALVILAIALTAVFATFISQQKSFTVQNRVAEMQQNLRQAVEYMSRDIRMAGYGIPDNVTIPNNVIATGVTSIRSLYAKDNTTGPDQIYILYLFDMDDNQRSTWNTAPMANGAGTVTVDNTDGFLPAPAGELVIVTDLVKAQLFQTGSKTATTLNFGGTIYPGTASSTYATGSPPPAPSTVAKARFNRYFIDNTTDPAHPTLVVDRMAGQPYQPVADDIEDMQLTYGIDNNADGIIENWSSSPTTPSQIRQVRLQFIARTRLPEAGWSELRPALGNRAAATTPDGYRRRIYDIVIDVRNSGV